ncbi:pyrokinin-1 receptor-like [Hetaerina americana]|uniref:pyrokinin-1 receptor-like n=1 Tax=Hetaerina americana TaxID=62018 RepID=UPI003A7F2DFA
MAAGGASPGARAYAEGAAGPAAGAERGAHAYQDGSAASVAPKVRDSLAVVIPVTTVYLTIFITGILGNVITCLVIRRNKSMHTATNFYLFSLSISDLLLLITGLPQEMYYIWSRYPYIFGEVFCILRGLAAETSANATVLTITAFTVERYMAICHPFYSRTPSKLSRATRLILVVWLVALVFAIPSAAQVGVVVKENSDYSTCTIKLSSYAHYFCFLSVIFFLIPMNIIVVLYALIGLRLRRSNGMELMAGASESAADASDARHPAHGLRRGARPSSHKSTRRVVKMLVAVVIAFFLCWAPFHTQRLVAIYGSNSDNTPKNPHMLQLYGIITYVSGILYYLSTTINPILYNIMSHRFREAFKETVWICCRRCRTDNRRPYNNLPQGIQRPCNIGETDFASRNPRCVTDSKSGSSTRRTGSRGVAMPVEAAAGVGFLAVKPGPAGVAFEPGTPAAKPSSVEGLFTVHQALFEAGQSKRKAEEDGMVVVLTVAASVVPAVQLSAAGGKAEPASFNNGQEEAKIPG